MLILFIIALVSIEPKRFGANAPYKTARVCHSIHTISYTYHLVERFRLQLRWVFIYTWGKVGKEWVLIYFLHHTILFIIPYNRKYILNSIFVQRMVFFLTNISWPNFFIYIIKRKLTQYITDTIKYLLLDSNSHFMANINKRLHMTTRFHLTFP